MRACSSRPRSRSTANVATTAAVATDACNDACDPYAPIEQSFPEGCVPLVHDGEVCLRALHNASCSDYEGFVSDNPPPGARRQMQLLPAALTRRVPSHRRAHFPATHAPSRGRSSARPQRVLAAIATSGCVSIAETMVAPQDEYVLTDACARRAPETRLAASWAYVEQYPHGRWISEIRPWFLRAELEYFEQRGRAPPDWPAYLALLPAVPTPRRRVSPSRSTAPGRERNRAERLGLEALYTESRLAALALEREQVRDAVPTCSDES